MNTPPPTDEDFARVNAELRAAVRARDEFLAIAAHELRSPLHALLLQMTTVVEVAKRSGESDMVARLERVRRTVERYVHRATTLLEVSRINAGELKLRLEECDLAAVVRETCEAFAAEAAYHGSQVEIDAPDVLSGRWDRVALEQIATNLLVNAIKYGDGKPIRISLIQDGSWAQLKVRDEGIGISVEDQARIFERFEQAVSGRTQAGGFGVGLWLVRSLVEAHRGSIAIESAPNRGAAFTVRLPTGSAQNLDAT